MPKSEPAPAPARALSLHPESSLRRRLAARDEQALVELIDTASPWLLGVAQSMLSDPDEAEEVVLEAFAAAWDHVGALGEAHESLMPWLLRITRNRAIDRLRRRARRRAKLARAEAFGALGTGRVGPAEPDESARPGWHVHESVHTALAAGENGVAVTTAKSAGAFVHSSLLGAPLPEGARERHAETETARIKRREERRAKFETINFGGRR